MNLFKGAPLSSRHIAYLWNRKARVILAVICLVAAFRVLLNVLLTNDAVTNPSLHSNIRFKAMAKEKVFLRSDQNYDVPFTLTKKIIILSYMRSGSTLVGDIIQSHPDVFYIYEPLLYLWDYYIPRKMGATSDLWKRTKSFWRSFKADIAPPLDFMTYMFNCNLTAKNLRFLTNAAHSRQFQSANCPIYKNNMHIVNTSNYCVNILTKRCSEAKAVLLKVVRLSMAEADKFLAQDPKVKIIHLIRDPRGILLSRINFNNKETGEMHKNYTNVCRRIFEDVKMSKIVSNKYHGRILTVRYEDLAQNLEGFTIKMFNFLGLPINPEVLQHLKEITKSEDTLPNRKIRAKKTRRKNPYKTAYHWRSVLSFPLVQKVDRSCKKLYKVMGYRPFITEEDLRNEDLSPRFKHYGDGLITAML